jgi:hypothetical protein
MDEHTHTALPAPNVKSKCEVHVEKRLEVNGLSSSSL